MADEQRLNPAADVLAEIARLRAASEESLQRYIMTLKRIAELEGKLEVRPGGTMRVKGGQAPGREIPR